MEALQAERRPLVIWHGMGDSYNAPGMLEVIDEIKNMHPGIFVHSVHLAEETDDDRKAAYVRKPSSFTRTRNTNRQVATVRQPQ